MSPRRTKHIQDCRQWSVSNLLRVWTGAYLDIHPDSSSLHACRRDGQMQMIRHPSTIPTREKPNHREEKAHRVSSPILVPRLEWGIDSAHASSIHFRTSRCSLARPPPRRHPTQPISACAPEQKNKSKMTHPIILLVPPSICANPHSHTSRANVRPSAHTPAVAPCKSTPKKRPPFFCPPLPHMPWRLQGPKKSIFGKIPRHHWSMTPRIHQGSSRVPACRTNRPALLHRKWSLEVAFPVEDGPDEARCKISVTGWMGAARVSRRGGAYRRRAMK